MPGWTARNYGMYMRIPLCLQFLAQAMYRDSGRTAEARWWQGISNKDLVLRIWSAWTLVAPWMKEAMLLSVWCILSLFLQPLLYVSMFSWIYIVTLPHQMRFVQEQGSAKKMVVDHIIAIRRLSSIHLHSGDWSIRRKYSSRLQMIIYAPEWSMYCMWLPSLPLSAGHWAWIRRWRGLSAWAMTLGTLHSDM